MSSATHNINIKPAMHKRTRSCGKRTCHDVSQCNREHDGRWHGN